MSENHTPRASWDASQFPYYKRWAKDFLSSGRLAMMTHLQRSLYSVMLDRAWVEDGLPTEPRELAAMALCTPAELEEAWTYPLDDAFVLGDDGKLRSPRMEVEREDAVRLRDARSRGGKSPRRVFKESSETLPTGIEDQANNSQSQSESQSNSPSESTGAKAPRSSTRQSRAKNLAAAIEESGVDEGLHGPLGEYLEARKGARLGVWSVKRWLKEIGSLAALDPEDARLRCEAACDKPWAKIVYPDQKPMNGSPASSQAHSAGRWYTGPRLKDIEARTRRREIAHRMQVLKGVIFMPEDEALEMGREMNDWKTAEYDWLTGRRNDLPPKPAQEPTTVEVNP